MQKLVRIFFLFFVVAVGSIATQAKATYITIPAAACSTSIDPDDNDCANNRDGGVYGTTTGDLCVIYCAIPVDTSKTLGSVTVYYYDKTSTQYILAVLYKLALSTDTNTAIDSFDDSTTSSSIQYDTLSASTAMSSSYAYYVKVHVTYGTKLIGIKVYYY